jgi:hypothetical protein
MKVKLSCEHTDNAPHQTLGRTAARRNQHERTRNMKLQTKILVTAIALAGSAAYLIAQNEGGPGPGPRGPGGPGGPGGRRPVPPIIAVLDANHDGVIDAAEIDNAPAALRKLDKNGDGKLTMDELMPPPPNGRGPSGPGGPGGPQGPGGPGGQEGQNQVPQTGN